MSLFIGSGSATLGATTADAATALGSFFGTRFPPSARGIILETLEAVPLARRVVLVDVKTKMATGDDHAAEKGVARERHMHESQARNDRHFRHFQP